MRTVHWRKHCNLKRIAKKCPIYLYTSGGCDNCGHNLKNNKNKGEKH